MWLCDIVILIVQALFSDLNAVLYGIILVVIYSLLLEKTMMLGKSRIELLIVSEKSDEIKQAILSRIDRGVTLSSGKTGYLGRPVDLVLSVISSRELPKTEQVIHGIDPEAFIIVSRVSEVRGRGFSEKKKYL